ncbi:hypothetical protein [Streptomyces aureoverticillatus]|uniref:hypothetical protein n=1 Tax=Streptomyces aureoverticillatus TaxID=66871 RepID=UPI001EF7C61B|nr:hypothetical protein [Streptomyces aureoverticillatus]
MTSPAVTENRPPVRPLPHGRRPRPDGGGARPRSCHLRVDATVERGVGPRRPGAIYQNVDGRFEVLALITRPREAAALLRRDSARWALIVRDTLRPDGEPFAIGSVWTVSDYLIRPAPSGASAIAYGSGGRSIG